MIIRKMIGRRALSREERAQITEGARRRVRECDEMLNAPNAVRLQALVALHAVKKMFHAGAPILRHMNPSDQRAWETRRKFLEQWLQALGDKGF
jgi:hypothetical protein